MRRNAVNVLMGLFVAVVFGMAGCGGGGGENAPNNKVTAADAGPAQNIVSGSLVTLNGAQSTGADGNLIIYQWSMVSKPAGSVANINNPTTVNPTFTADLPGQYFLKLTITDEKSATSEATVTITASVFDAAPVANAGAAQSVIPGAFVTLDGSASSDANRDWLTYSWSFTSKPNGSSVALSSSTVVNPTFTPDVAGAYVLNLVVNDGKMDSAVATVTITAAAANTAPVANTGLAQSVVTGALVTLDGSASSDANGDLLTFSWSFTSKPNGSSVALSNAIAAKPMFTPDVAGAYVLNLVVNDGKMDSAVATVTISAAAANAAPVANAGLAKSVVTGALVTLDGSASSDANRDWLTYSWSFTSKPNGSSVALSSSTVVKPTFIPDVVGAYVLNLVVNDGKVDSAVAIVTITATPFAAADAYAWLGNSRIIVPAANGVLTNDTATTGVVPVQKAGSMGGTVNISADGGFTYEPPLNITGIDTFTYTATGAGGTTATGTVTITIGAVVRYVKNDFVGTSNGSSTAPFTTLTAAMALAGPGDTIFVFTGNPATVYNGRINLLANQRLIGQGLGLTFDVLPANPDNPLLPITGVAATTALAATPPVLTHTAAFAGNLPMIALANNVEVSGLVIDGATAVSSLMGMSGTAVGFNIHDNTIRNLPKAAIQLLGATGGTGMIVNNKLENILGANPDNAIDIVTIGAGIDFTLTGNTLSNVLDSGIRVQFPGGGKVAVSNNTLTNVGTIAYRRGIDVDGAGTVTISGNNVDNTAGAPVSRSGIQLNASGALNASVTDNTILNAAPADGGIQAQTTIPAADLCLRMTGNTTANNFILDNRATGAPASFRIEGPLQADFEAANTGTFNYLLNPAAVSFVPVGTCDFAP